MQLTDDNTALTHWTDEDDVEWDIKILFSYQPAEGPDYEDGHMTYPGCDAGIVDLQVERNIPIYDIHLTRLVDNWVLQECTDDEVAAYSVEIMEAIDKQAMDDRGNEQ